MKPLPCKLEEIGKRGRRLIFRDNGEVNIQSCCRRQTQHRANPTQPILGTNPIWEETQHKQYTQQGQGRRRRKKREIWKLGYKRGMPSRLGVKNQKLIVDDTPSRTTPTIMCHQRRPAVANNILVLSSLYFPPPQIYGAKKTHYRRQEPLCRRTVAEQSCHVWREHTYWRRASVATALPSPMYSFSAAYTPSPMSHFLQCYFYRLPKWTILCNYLKSGSRQYKNKINKFNSRYMKCNLFRLFKIRIQIVQE